MAGACILQHLIAHAAMIKRPHLMNGAAGLDKCWALLYRQVVKVTLRPGHLKDFWVGGTTPGAGACTTTVGHRLSRHMQGYFCIASRHVNAIGTGI